MNTATLVATFQDYSAAKRAARELENLGIPNGSVNVHSNQKTAGAGSVDRESAGESHSGFIGWWKDTFGSGDDYSNDRRGYEQHLESGRAILRATVSDALIDAAVNTLNRNGALEIQHNQQSGMGQESGGTRSVPRGGVRVYSQNEPLVQTGMRATGLSPRPPAPNVMSGGAGTPGAGTLAGEATAGLNSQDFTPEYGRKFEQTYRTEPGFDAMGSAFDYGHRTAADTRFRGRSWDEVENDIRTDWEKNNPKSEWNRDRDAVRQGWDKARSSRQ